jgi:phage/plasmid primase-like uncharacterized protein
MNADDPIAAFEDALRGRGIVPPRRLMSLADGKLRRCDAAGRNGQGDAAFVLHLDDFPAGGFENHRDGRGWENWHADIKREFTAKEREEYRRRMEEARRQRDEDQRQRFAEAADLAERLLVDMSPCPVDHPYLRAKGVGAHGVFLHHGRIVVPVRDLDGKALSLQFIDGAGGKRFLTGGQVKAGCHIIAAAPLNYAEIIVIGEGYATLSTIFEASGYACIVVFNSGNLPTIAKAVREQYPGARLVIAADDDHLSRDAKGNLHNAGLIKAREAAVLARAHLAVPNFGDNRSDEHTDFNDLYHAADGEHDAVHAQIDAAIAGPLYIEPDPVAPPKRIVTGKEFIASFVPPDWLVEGIVQRGRLYSCTSPTGHGKTAIWLYIGCMLQTGRKVGHLETVPGNVLILAGENAEDHKARMIGMVKAFNIAVDRLPYALPATFPLSEQEADKLRQDISALGVPFVLIIEDTFAAFFPGDDENSNPQTGAYTRTLRTLTECDGNPAVVSLCHPVKNASRDNLLPRGGGATLNEVDGNLTLWAERIGEATMLHWQGKIRGPDFDPVIFKLKPVNTELKDKQGRDVITVVAHPIDEMEAAHENAQALENENAVLRVLNKNPKWSQGDIARALGWIKHDDANNRHTPERWKVQRAINVLVKENLVRKSRGKCQLTEAGKKALAEAEDESP